MESRPVNLSPLDRLRRASLAIGLLVAALFVQAPLHYLAWATLPMFAVYPLFSALSGYCPIYNALGVKNHRTRSGLATVEALNTDELVSTKVNRAA